MESSSQAQPDDDDKKELTKRSNIPINKTKSGRKAGFWFTGSEPVQVRNLLVFDKIGCFEYPRINPRVKDVLKVGDVLSAHVLREVVMSLVLLSAAWISACRRRDLSAGIVENGTHVEFMANGEQVAKIARTRLDDPRGPAAIVTELERRYPVNGAAVIR